MELVVADNLNTCCSNEEIKASTFGELEDKDAAATQLALLGEK